MRQTPLAPMKVIFIINVEMGMDGLAIYLSLLTNLVSPRETTVWWPERFKMGLSGLLTILTILLHMSVFSFLRKQDV